MQRGKNSLNWLENNQFCDKMCANYTQVSIGDDDHGDFYVILKRNSIDQIDLFFVKLTENKAFSGTNTNLFDKELGAGYWVKIKGN